MEIDRIVETLAAAQGPAPGADSVSDAKQLQQWGQRDPKVLDPEGLKRQLMETGLGPYPEMLDPENGLAIVKAHPEIAEMLAEPTDEALADMLSRLAEFPLRVGILEPWADDPEEMVRVADSLDARWQREMGTLLDTAPAQVAPAQQTIPSGQYTAPAPGPTTNGALDVPAAPQQPALSMIGG